jgi:transcriptional regulator with XRE-family HTH domain
VYHQIFLTNVLRLLEEHSMTKHELAERANISVSFLSDLTNDKGNPSLKIMEQIANALETPLPALLELSDLERDAFAELAEGQAIRLLPDGYHRVTAVLTEFQVFAVRQWDKKNQKILRSKNKSLSSK